MKRSVLMTILSGLLLSGPIAMGGFDIPKAGPNAGSIADGEPLGRPERPNPDFNPTLPSGPRNPKLLPEDPIAPNARSKILATLNAQFTREVKCTFGLAAWNALDAAAQAALFGAEVAQRYDERFAPGKTWAMLTPAEQGVILNRYRTRAQWKAFIEERIQKDLGCAEWDSKTQDQKDALLDARRDALIITMIGQTAFDALTPDEKAAKRASLPDDKIKAFRCNMVLALEVIACIPQPTPNPLGIPSGADAADCVRKTWEVGRLCIDMVSAGAYGSVLPDCAGKAAGCAPNKAPINIAYSTFPCRKISKVYDPDFYIFLTTVYHEGIHTLQAATAKAAFTTPFHQFRELAAKERPSHGAENIFIAALCPAMDVAIAGGVPGDGGNPAVKKFTDCIKDIPDAAGVDPDADRKIAARDLKAALRRNKAGNDYALTCYNDYIRIMDDFFDGVAPHPTAADTVAALKKLRWIEGRLGAKQIIAGGGSNIVEQIDYDPVDATPFQQDLIVPVDEVTEIAFGLLDSILLVVGNDSFSNEGVLLAYWDTNGDGFVDPGTEQELIRDVQLFGSMDLIVHPVTGELLAVNLLTGEVFALLEDPTPGLFDELPDFAQPLGRVFDPEFLDQDLTMRVGLSSDGNVLSGYYGLQTLAPPVLYPGADIPQAQFDFIFGFLPLPVQPAFQMWGLSPIFVDANGLPVNDTTGTINQLSRFLVVSGTPGARVQVQIVPPPPALPISLPPQPLAPEGFTFVFVDSLKIGDIVRILDLDAGKSSVDYLVRDVAARLTNWALAPGANFTVELDGVPGQLYQIGQTNDLQPPFALFGPPVLAGEDPVLLGPFPLDPSGGNSFFATRPVGKFLK